MSCMLPMAVARSSSGGVVIRPANSLEWLSHELFAWLSVWSKVQIVCKWSGRCHFWNSISYVIKIPNGFTFLIPRFTQVFWKRGHYCVFLLCYVLWVVVIANCLVWLCFQFHWITIRTLHHRCPLLCLLQVFCHLALHKSGIDNAVWAASISRQSGGLCFLQY